MNSEIYGIPIDGKKFAAPEYTSDELDVIITYVETGRHINELDDLFQMFCFQLNNLLNCFELKVSDKIKQKFGTANEYIAINALTINYISAGKTLTEAIEAFIKELCSGDDERFKSLKKKVLSDMYDTCFYYRLLLHLRNFAQHGHLPVSIDAEKKAYFDLNHFLNTPHYNHNAELRNESERISKDIHEKYKDIPKIVFTKSIAEFNICIIKIYLAYLREIAGWATEIQEKLEYLISARSVIKETENGMDLIKYYDKNITNMGHILILDERLPKILQAKKKSTLELLDAEIKQMQVFPKLKSD